MTEPKIPDILAPLIERIERAKTEVTTAEGELDAALHAIESMPREQKRAVSQAVQDAFTKVRAVRKDLIALQETVIPSLLEPSKD